MRIWGRNLDCIEKGQGFGTPRYAPVTFYFLHQNPNHEIAVLWNLISSPIKAIKIHFCEFKREEFEVLIKIYLNIYDHRKHDGDAIRPKHRSSSGSPAELFRFYQHSLVFAKACRRYLSMQLEYFFVKWNNFIKEYGTLVFLRIVW